MAESCEVPVQRPLETRAAARRRALFEEALGQIESSYGDNRLTVDWLSQKIFTSRRQLQRAFAESGTSVQERLHAVRMERAAELLQATSLSVAEVARSVGYRQRAQFAKAFRRYHQLAPSQWRNAINSNPTNGEVIPMDCKCGCQASSASQAPEAAPRPNEQERDLEPRPEQDERQPQELDAAA